MIIHVVVRTVNDIDGSVGNPDVKVINKAGCLTEIQD